MINSIWIIFSVFFSIVSFFPLINSTHWIFRIFDFIRLQLCVILLFLLSVTPFLFENITIFEATTTIIIFISIIYQVSIILPYLPKSIKKSTAPKNGIVVLSVNVLQENKEYKELISLVNDIQPDILLTIETDEKWEQGLHEIESIYSHVIRVPKDNRYGMHLYTKLDLKNFNVHFLISKDHPSIEAILTDRKNNDFIFWGIHPPPPSPTEKPTSKQKDAELMKLAKIARKKKVPMVVSGDFNNVSWSKSSKLFSKISNLKDGRINRGIYSTFPAKFKIFGFPIDLIFHSKSISVNKIKVLKSIGSDHLPLLFSFDLISELESNTTLDKDLKNLANQKILEGKEAANNEN